MHSQIIKKQYKSDWGEGGEDGAWLGAGGEEDGKGDNGDRIGELSETGGEEEWDQTSVNLDWYEEEKWNSCSLNSKSFVDEYFIMQDICSLLSGLYRENTFLRPVRQLYNFWGLRRGKQTQDN